MHPGAGRRDGTLVNGLLFRYPEIADVGGRGRPGIVHRLDMDTSGILLVARTDHEYLSLVEQFANRTVSKTYLALVEGEFRHESGVISAPVARKPSDRRKMQIDWSGKEAVTRFRVVTRSRHVTFLELALITGRTHQARVHLAAVGHPVIGDTAYGNPEPQAASAAKRPVPTRQMLHAWRISAERPDKSRITCQAAMPADIARLAAEIGIAETVLTDYEATGWNSDE